MSLDKIQIGFDGECAVLIAPDPVKLTAADLRQLATVCSGLASSLEGGPPVGPIKRGGPFPQSPFRTPSDPDPSIPEGVMMYAVRDTFTGGGTE